MRNFEWLEPKSVGEASRMVGEAGEGAKLMASGTSLLLLMRQRIFSPTHVVSLGRLKDLDSIKFEDGALRIGALTRHRSIEHHPEIAARFPMITEMARRVANPQIRNMATIGGNLAHNDPASDPPACFLALNATVKTVRGKKTREIPLEKFFVDYYETCLKPDEVLTEIRIPALPPGSVGVYTRFTTTPAEDRPLLGVGMVLSLAKDKTITDARISLGASTPVPIRARAAEEALRGQPATEEVFARAGKAASEEVKPLDDFRGSADYRREIIKVIVRRTALRALERARGNGRTKA
ncbi:MAG: xanthine dehydrogenase family protein subunit M [Candidatus Tectomicrobia bacterium]|nr:xanthine dehydrogenase family protein subunit M [Candidatus Tectomicrobia bacterium]